MLGKTKEKYNYKMKDREKKSNTKINYKKLKTSFIIFFFVLYVYSLPTLHMKMLVDLRYRGLKNSINVISIMY